MPFFSRSFGILKSEIDQLIDTKIIEIYFRLFDAIVIILIQRIHWLILV